MIPAAEADRPWRLLAFLNKLVKIYRFYTDFAGRMITGQDADGGT